MAIDPRKLRPSECCRLLNSTPLGEVINERQLHRHRTRAGNRIGDGRHVDLLRYAAWLHEERHKPKPKGDEDPYAKLKAKSRERNAAIALAGRDIGEMPEVADPERKAKAAGSFRFFCEAYFNLTFHLTWSPDHLKVIAKIEEAVIRGGLFSLAMARGSGKSSLAEVACIWAVLNGYRDFVCLIGSDEGHACDMLDSIKTELDSNDLLAADYPEVCFPIQALDGISNRANGQLFNGKRTQIGWTAKEVVLPTIADSKASGAIIKVAGLTGRIRGMKFKRPDGKTVRPSLVVLDDPQTDESARSLSQCANREAILAGAVLGLAGPGKKISGIMPCTVIRPGDMADNILDRDKHPEWNGERTRMVYSFPTNETLWQRYAEIRAEGLRAGDGGAAGTNFYRDNRDAMDEGADVAWAERFNHDELSAIQHAMNLKLRDEAAFFAEYQNEPLPEETVGADQLTADQVAENQRHAPFASSDCSKPSDRIHRRSTKAVVLRGRRLGRRLHRLRHRLRNLSRSKTKLLHTSRRTINTCFVSRRHWTGRKHLRRPRIPNRITAWQRMAPRRWRGDEDRTLLDRRQLGPLHQRRLSILPAESFRLGSASVPRSFCWGFIEPIQRIQTPAW